ncbi:hypothetical protein BDD12DRAFT_807340 [Trichophaea hybrida]|nr:hypothetical protein BDD12DRAFT_807340 [Trichophaea hybrida]
MRAYTAKPLCITMHSPPSSPPSSPPQPHTGNDNCDSDENNYYIDVHDGSRILLELPPPKTMDEILSKAVASMNKVTDIDNYEVRTPANTDTAERHPETEPKSSLGCQRLSPMMTPTTMHGSLMRKAKYIQADPSDSSCDAEEGATAAANLQRKPKGTRSGSNKHSKMAWAIVVCTREYFENGMINVKGNTEQIATDYSGLLEKMEISGGIAKQIHDLKEQLHECELNGKQPGAGALKHDLKELSKQLIHDLNEQLHECELNGKQPGAGAHIYDLKELSKQLVLPLLSIRFCQLTLESNTFQERVLTLSL